MARKVNLHRDDTGFLDRLIERLDRLDPANVQAYVLRLVREKGFFQTIFNTIHEGVVVIDRSLKIHYANRAAQSFLGLPENIGNNRIDRYLRDVQWRRLMQADPEHWHRISLQEVEVFYPEHRFLNYYLVPYGGDGGDGDSEQIGMATIILHDITAAHQDTKETIESQKVQAITTLAAGVAHEIGNPLNSLNIHLQLLARALSGEPDAEAIAEAREMVAIASGEVSRLDAIVNQFLRAVRPTPPELERVQVTQILSESLEFMQQEISDRDILVEALWSENLPQVLGDPSQLKQAFYNIIKNAIQAMNGGGVLRIGCIARERFLEISFADTGKGITADQMSQLFEPYFTTRADGTGLGLLIVDRIVRSHGGELGLESEPGTGTLFTIRLPLRERRVHLLAAATTSAIIDKSAKDATEA